MDLGAVVGVDVVPGHLEGLRQLAGNLLQRSVQLLGRNPQLVDGDAVEPLGQLAHGGVPARLDLVQDGPHGIGRASGRASRAPGAAARGRRSSPGRPGGSGSGAQGRSTSAPRWYPYDRNCRTELSGHGARRAGGPHRRHRRPPGRTPSAKRSGPSCSRSSVPSSAARRRLARACSGPLSRARPLRPRPSPGDRSYRRRATDRQLHRRAEVGQDALARSGAGGRRTPGGRAGSAAG